MSLVNLPAIYNARNIDDDLYNSTQEIFVHAVICARHFSPCQSSRLHRVTRKSPTLMQHEWNGGLRVLLGLLMSGEVPDISIWPPLGGNFISIGDNLCSQSVYIYRIYIFDFNGF